MEALTCSPLALFPGRRPRELGEWCREAVSVTELEEGAETPEFWVALGQENRTAYDCMLQDPGRCNFTVRLFRMSAASGQFAVTELVSPVRDSGMVTTMPFLQEDLYCVPQPGQ
uniref:Uncharacterized protein n=1 Tax=Callorhinchus milii TaxID=7868 RepID=A0A4W3HQX9_CALMI